MRFKIRGNTYRLTTFSKIIIIFIVIVLFAIFIYWLLGQHNRNQEKLDTSTNNSYRYIHNEPNLPNNYSKLAVEESYQDIRVTSYYVDDWSGSGSVTGSGVSIGEFDINENGWYMYQGKLVIAAATSTCTNATTGACSQYNSIPAGFKQYDYFDEVNIEIDGNDYQAIVLDSCGASYWPEEVQRYDIFVSNKDSVIDTKGKVILSE